MKTRVHLQDEGINENAILKRIFKIKTYGCELISSGVELSLLTVNYNAVIDLRVPLKVIDTLDC
jgi:hypothetical protein